MPPKNPQPLNYLTPGNPPQPARSLLSLAGFHFVAGAVLGAIASAMLLLFPIWLSNRDAPPTLGGGGFFVVLLQALVLAVTASVRQWRTGRLLYECNALLTFTAGAIGAALVFWIPFTIEQFTAHPAAKAVAYVLPLFVYPILICFAVFRKSRVF